MNLLHPGPYLPTLFLTTALSVAICSVLLVVARRRGQPMDALFWWGLTMVLAAVGLVLMEAGAVAPRFVVLDVARGLLVLATACWWTATRALVGLRPRPVVALAGVAVWLVACRFAAFEASQAAQVTLGCAIGSIYNGGSVLVLWRARHEGLRLLPAAIALTALHTALYGIRAFLAATGLDQGIGDLLAAVLLLEGQLRSICTTFMLLDMTRERSDRLSVSSLAAARQANAARERFLAHMSHEIRTPLHAVFGLAQVLALDERLLPDHREHVGTMETAGRHLLAIVNDALDLAKIDAGQFDLVTQPFPLIETLEGCLALVRPAATAKRIALDVGWSTELPAHVVGNRVRLQQILLNLLWNAVRFTPSGGAITLHAAMPTERRLTFDVIDSGPGIPLDQQGRLFTDFTQLDPSSAEAMGGSGLGLAISAQLAERMGGRIGYATAPAGGSRFWLELPWAAAAAMGIPATSNAEA